MITLYDCSTAPSPRRARIFLREKGVPYQTVEVDLRSGEQFSPAYRAINPHCTVPALHIHDGSEAGVVLTDNAAIAAYLEARFPEPPLMGVTPSEKAAIASWHWRAEFEGLLAVAEALRNSSPAMANRALPGPTDYAQIPQLAERGVARLGQFLQALNAQLEGRLFVAARQFSIADITALVAVDFARIVKVKPTEETHPHLLRWRAEMGKRQSVG